MTTFLYSAITHACLNRIRNGKTRLRLLQEHASSDSASAGPSAEQLAVLRSALASMPEPLAQVAVYRYVDELTHDDIARILDCSRRHVGDLLERLDQWSSSKEAATCEV